MATKTLPTLFTVIFENGSSFVGGTTYSDTKWLEIPNEKIKRLFYRLPHGDFLCLSGYDKYYHIVEATTDLNGKRRGETRLEYAYIMGKLGTKVMVYKINLKIGNIKTEIFNKEDKFVKGLNPNGWK